MVFLYFFLGIFFVFCFILCFFPANHFFHVWMLKHNINFCRHILTHSPVCLLITTPFDGLLIPFLNYMLSSRRSGNTPSVCALISLAMRLWRFDLCTRSRIIRICMCELKYIGRFCHYIIYIAKEGRHVRVCYIWITLRHIANGYISLVRFWKLVTNSSHLELNRSYFLYFSPNYFICLM